MKSFSLGCNWQVALAAVVLLCPALVMAAGPSKKATLGPADPNAQAVELFDGIAKGDLAVKVIMKDSKEGAVRIQNKTDRPLSVKLPESFGVTPVMAQVGGVGRGVGGGVGAGGGQGAGGGFGGMGGMGGGMGMFNIPPEAVGQLPAITVCLEHGKAEPRPSMPYEIKPIESVTSIPAVQELTRMVGTGQIDQQAAQAAAWHLNNNMSWEQLAAKRLKFANGSSRPYFSPQQLQFGMQLAAVATQQAQQRPQKAQPSPGQTTPATGD